MEFLCEEFSGTGYKTNQPKNKPNNKLRTVINKSRSFMKFLSLSLNLVYYFATIIPKVNINKI